MGKLIRSKREYRCSACEAKSIKWSGICAGCGKAGTMQEVMLVPLQKTATATASQRSLQRRSKKSERNIAARMTAVDGVDPQYEKITTSTGRVGHITNIRVDAISKHYVTENKNRGLPSWLINAWVLINQRAEDFDKYSLLHLDPPNMPKEFPINGTLHKLDTMAVITQTRHEQLITESKRLDAITEIMNSKSSNLAKLRKIDELLR